MVIGFDIVAF